MMPSQPDGTAAATIRRVTLVVIDRAKRINLPDQPEAVVGRADTVGNVPDVDLAPFNGQALGVGRRHARLRVQNGQVMLEDLRSSNHTYVGGTKLVPGQLHQLRDGDEVLFGKLAVQVRIA